MINCINCKSSRVNIVVKIDPQPLSGIFLRKKIKNQKKYPLNLYQCEKCKLVQFKKIIQKAKMFGDSYEYKTSLSKLMTHHMYEKVKLLKQKKFLKNNSKILDIGSNDGTFLNFFVKKKIELYGIDPSAKKFKKNYNKKINIIFDYFSKENIEKNFKSSRFNLITSFAMFYDVNDPNKFCSDIEKILDKNGVWILELSYLPLMLKNLTYDQICHEHVGYYTLSVFNQIVKNNKLRIIDVSFNEINGGSIEIICVKNKSRFRSNLKNINKVLEEEKKITKIAYENFNKRIEKTKKLLQMFLELNSKKKIIGYGASTKGNIVLNHAKVTNSQIKEICDGSHKKIGKYTPGTNIKIISKKRMRKINPDYLLVLIWSFRKEVIKQEYNYLKKGGKLVFLLPRFHIINFDNYKKYLNSDFKPMSYQY
jgi:NDP-4-keto-2,6-dideoxyhexose 3-C-methyltransferase